jgi:hypothetical protein
MSQLLLARRGLLRSVPKLASKSKQLIKSKTFCTNHRPPLGIRAALVGTTVGLLTPVFAIAGIATSWFRYLPKTFSGRIVKYIIGASLGGGSGVLIWNYVLPFLNNHSEIVLPFALANSIAASSWYVQLILLSCCSFLILIHPFLFVNDTSLVLLLISYFLLQVYNS